MAEQLGGSRGRNDGLSSTMSTTRRQGGASTPQRLGGTGLGGGAGGGGLLANIGNNGPPRMSGTARPLTARNAAGQPVGPGAARRPSSAPRERSAAPNYTKDGYMQGGGSPADARARVEELRQIKEADFWGREAPVKRELPPYWSVSAFGQPFNDQRLFTGANNHYQILEPAGLKSKDARVVGPATEQQAALRKSLVEGKRLFNRADFAPLQTGEAAAKLEEPDRILVMSKLTPFQRVHALRNCLDRDTRAADFTPWTQMVWERLDAKFWKRNKEMAVRLAVQKLENLMRRHLLYLSEQKCAAARAPAARTKDVLREAFWKVDIQRTGCVSLAQFLQVWQNVLCLLEYEDTVVSLPNGRTRVVLKPGRRFLMDLNMCAGIFVKYGFDKDALMPYVVFATALTAAPARLLGQELVLDKKDEGRHGLSSEVDVAYCVGDAKILYPKCDTGVFPPSGFDPRLADRSRLPPYAHMWLEHVYGYAGMDTLQTNVWYTANTSKEVTECVYYAGCVGIVFDKELFDRGQPCQRFFFGHDNDIQFLTIHPSRKWVATGQQKATGSKSVPYVCIWDIDSCNLLQRLDHAEEERSVIAGCFSGNINAPSADKQGGDLLVTVTSDDKHTIHIWRWMMHENKYCKAVNVPGWFFGPHKKLDLVRHQGPYYRNPEDKDEEGKTKPWLVHPTEDEAYAHYKSLKAAPEPRQPLIERVHNKSNCIITDWEYGYCDAIPPARDDGTWAKIEELPGCNGTPPMIYGVAWNPFRPQDGRRGSEFLSYGVKHLKTWIVNDDERWQGATASFGTDHIENVLSAAFVPALHYMAAPGDSCILTGFASGQVGLWIPPYPTRAGAVYQLTKKFDAHGTGPLRTLNDGTQQYGGVRVIRLRADPHKKESCGRELLTAGSDGRVIRWQLKEVTGTRKDGTPLRGVNLECMAKSTDPALDANIWLLQGPTAPYQSTVPPEIVALDCHPAKPDEFIAGTDGCDIWEVDRDPRVLVEGHEEDIWHVATHPTDPAEFATACGSGQVRIWSSAKRDVVRSAALGFPIAGIAYSNEAYACKANGGKANLHIALGSAGGYTGVSHKIVVIDQQSLQPLKVMMEVTAQVDELKYSPAAGPGILAAGARDQTIYLYNCNAEYQLIAKCVGHSGNVEHIDWSLPISLPGSKLHGTMILQASDASTNLLNWNPTTGKKIPYNQRDAPWASYTNTIGFSAMGIWPDNSDRTDINSTCRSSRGAPVYIPPKDKNATPSDRAASVLSAPEEESADGVPTAGYLATGDDFSTVRLFNYPVVWDDAPYKAFRGHSSFVTCVRFNSDDRYLLSSGGHDRCIFQWKTCGVNKEDSANDTKLLAAWHTAIRRRGEKDSVLEPKPGVEWVPLDPEGKVYGPKGVAELQKDPLMASMPGTPAATLNRQLTSAVSKFAANSSPSQTIGSVTRVIRT